MTPTTARSRGTLRISANTASGTSADDRLAARRSRPLESPAGGSTFPPASDERAARTRHRGGMTTATKTPAAGPGTPAAGRIRTAWVAAHAPAAGVPRWARVAAYAVRERRLRLRRAACGGAGIPPQTLHRGGLHQRDPHGTRGRGPALSGRRPPARHPPWRAGRPRAGRGEPHRPGSRGPAAHRPGPVQRGDRGRAVPRRGDREDPRTQRAGQARRPGPRTSGHHGLRERLHPLKAPREVTAVRFQRRPSRLSASLLAAERRLVARNGWSIRLFVDEGHGFG